NSPALEPRRHRGSLRRNEWSYLSLKKCAPGGGLVKCLRRVLDFRRYHGTGARRAAWRRPAIRRARDAQCAVAVIAPAVERSVRRDGTHVTGAGADRRERDELLGRIPRRDARGDHGVPRGAVAQHAVLVPAPAIDLALVVEPAGEGVARGELLED